MSGDDFRVQATGTVVNPTHNGGPMLIKTRSVLHRVDLHGAEGDEFVTFERLLDEPDGLQRMVKLAVADWHELGDPDTITIAIEPGAILDSDDNGED